MKIKRSISVSGTIQPFAVNFLDHIPSDFLFFKSHQLRHPDSIYRLSLEKLAEAFISVTTEYLAKTKEYSSECDAFEVTELLRHQESFLRTAQEHIDDCWLILKSLIDPATARKQLIFADQYVTANKLPGAKGFQETIRDYKQTLIIANKLKHQQGRLRGVCMWLPNPHLGYFLEAPDAYGSIGPSPEIHPDKGAFSFARDLTWHLFNVYRTSEKLVSAIKNVLGASNRGIEHNPIAASTGNDKWEEAISLAAQIPNAFFPKEIGKSIASFSYQQQEGILTIECPKHTRLILPSSAKTVCSTVIDRFSPSFSVPFP